MQVSKADINDIEPIVRLNRLFHLDYPWFIWDTKEYVQEEIENDNYFIIKSKVFPIAAICLNFTKMEGYIETIAVEQDMQGKGLGKSLIYFAKDHCKNLGKSKLSVESFCVYGVEGFYKKCGFIKSPKIGNCKGYDCFSFYMDL